MIIIRGFRDYTISDKRESRRERRVKSRIRTPVRHLRVNTGVGTIHHREVASCRRKLYGIYLGITSEGADTGELDGGCRSGLVRIRFGKVAIGSAGLSVFIYMRRLLRLACTYTWQLLYRAISDD